MKTISSRSRPGVWLIVLVLGAGVWGCAGLLKTSAPLPVRNAIVSEQLVVYSNFHVSAHDPLVDDLKMQREDLLKKLDLTGSEQPVHVYLFETESLFKSFVKQHYPEFPARRAFFVKSDAQLAVYAQWGEHVVEDLRHEMAHGYLHSVLPHIPLWLDEGLAEYFEVPRGSHGLNRPHVQLLMSKLQSEGWRPHLGRLERITSVADMTQDDYAESWAWVHWLLESSPDRSRMLCKYLDSLDAEEMFVPISAGVKRQWPQAEQELVKHLSELPSRS